MEHNQEYLEIIGAGWGRTGTMSLKAALEILGCPCYHMIEVIQRNHSSFWIKLADDQTDNFDEVYLQKDVTFTAAVDMPAAVYWEKHLKAFPHAKVILTMRDPEKWYKSAMDTILQIAASNPKSSYGIRVAAWLGFPSYPFVKMFNKVILRDCFKNDWSKENIIRCYNQHNQRVIDTCPKDQLLVFEVAQGWEPLCKFLGKPVPDVPFPRISDTEDFRRKTRYIRFIGNFALTSLCILLLLLLVVLQSGYIDSLLNQCLDNMVQVINATEKEL